MAVLFLSPPEIPLIISLPTFYREQTTIEKVDSDKYNEPSTVVNNDFINYLRHPKA